MFCFYVHFFAESFDVRLISAACPVRTPYIHRFRLRSRDPSLAIHELSIGMRTLLFPNVVCIRKSTAHSVRSYLRVRKIDQPQIKRRSEVDFGPTIRRYVRGERSDDKVHVIT